MIRRSGDRIGDWVVESTLGAGGMGTVFRCHNALAERIRAAVKVLRPDDSPDFRERFIREVEALEQLEHPAIVRVKGWGEDEQGWLWLAMDLVDGRDLGACLESGALTADQAIAVFTDLAKGLAHAHSRNVFHRDIKPANILLQSGSPAAKLVDFGIAMHGGRTRLSTAGLVPGTPAYLAPEVFGGTPHPQLLDIYALGQVLYESLTNTPAFPEPDGMTTTARIAHVAGSKLRQQPLDPGDVPEHLRMLVRRATHPDPTKRVQDMETFASALAGEVLAAPAAAATLCFDLDAIEPEPPAAAPGPGQPSPVPPPAPAPIRQWVLGAAFLVGFLSLFALPAILLLGGSTPLFMRIAEPLAQPPAPRVNPYPALDGVKVRVLFMPKESEAAMEVVDRLESYGAIVDLLSMPHADFSYFGRIIIWDPRFDAASRAIEESVKRLGTAEHRAPVEDKREDRSVDIAVWFKAY